MVVIGSTRSLARKILSGAVGERRRDVEIKADQGKEVRFVHVYARSSPLRIVFFARLGLRQLYCRDGPHAILPLD
jgi:hypothetical protein